MRASVDEGGKSLWEALGQVRDHRRREGQRYPLAGLLLIAVAALLAGRRDQLGIVRWCDMPRLFSIEASSAGIFVR